VDVVGGIQERALKLDTSECDLGDRNRPWVARFTGFIYDEHLIAVGLCRFYLHPPFSCMLTPLLGNRGFDPAGATCKPFSIQGGLGANQGLKYKC